jgi:hypothetical protein
LFCGRPIIVVVVVAIFHVVGTELGKWECVGKDTRALLFHG